MQSRSLGEVQPSATCQRLKDGMEQKKLQAMPNVLFWMQRVTHLGCYHTKIRIRIILLAQF